MTNPLGLGERIQVVGGKAAHLDWLKLHADELGYKVANYDVVDTSIFDAILESVGIRRKIEVIRGFAPKIVSGEYDPEEIIRIAEAESLNPFGVDNFRDQIRKLQGDDEHTPRDFLGKAIYHLSLAWSWDLPDEIRARLSEIHSPFNGQQYVMRSSATCEDGKKDSFAGLFKTEGPVVLTNRDIYNTFFGVDVISKFDFDEFVRSIGIIYGDFLQKREVELQDRIKLEDKIAIIIQKFVHTTPSGVVYTRLPEEPNILTLETVADTCNWVVNGNGTYITDFDRTTKKVDEVIANEGVENPLSEEQIQRVYSVAVELEKKYGKPLDIEFGFFEGDLYIFQARPITKESKADLVRPITGNYTIVTKTPVCINKGHGEGRLVEYNGPAKEIVDFDKSFGRDYLLQTNDHEHTWTLSHLTKNGHCVGAIVAGDKNMSRVCHNANDIRDSNVPVLGLKGIDLNQFLTNSSEEGIKYSDATFGIHSVKRRGVLYMR